MQNMPMRSLVIAAVLCGIAILGVPVSLPAELPPAAVDLLIVAPHPDDEVLGCAGVMFQAVEQKRRVAVVLMTNGDGFPRAAAVVAGKAEADLVAADFVKLARVRQQHSVGALGRIGLRAEDLIALAYPDSGLQVLYEATSDSPYAQRFTGRSETYAAVIADYHTLAHGRPAPYRKSAILDDLAEIIRTRRPKEIYTTSEVDLHPDHKTTFWFVRDAARRAGYRGNLFTFVVHGTPPSSPGQRRTLTKAQQARKRITIEEYQVGLSPIHDELAARYTRPEEVFWPIVVE